MHQTTTRTRLTAERQVAVRRRIDAFVDDVGAPDLTEEERRVLARALGEIECHVNLLAELDFARGLRQHLATLSAALALAQTYVPPAPDFFGDERREAMDGLRKAAGYLASLETSAPRLLGRKREGPVLKPAIQVRLAIVVGVFNSAIQRARWHKSAAWHTYFLLDAMSSSGRFSVSLPSATGEKWLLSNLSAYRRRYELGRFTLDGGTVHFDPAGSPRNSTVTERTQFDASIPMEWCRFLVLRSNDSRKRAERAAH